MKREIIGLGESLTGVAYPRAAKAAVTAGIVDLSQTRLDYRLVRSDRRQWWTDVVKVGFSTVVSGVLGSEMTVARRVGASAVDRPQEVPEVVVTSEGAKE